MRLRSFLLAGIMGTAGFLAGRGTRPPDAAASPRPAEVAGDPIPTPLRIAPDPAPDRGDAPDVNDAPDDDRDDDGEDVGTLLAGAQRHVEELRHTRNAIHGHVTDTRTGEPLIGVTIIATSPGLSVAQSAITDEHGDYEVIDLPAGSYTLTFYYNSTVETRDGVTVSALDATSVATDFDPTWYDEHVSFTGVESMENTYLVDTVDVVDGD